MATPTKHSKCSPSGAHRWLNCTASPTYEAQFPDGETSIYAKAGTLAHSFSELAAQYQFKLITKRTFNSRIKKLQEDELYDPEMLDTSQKYAEYLFNKAMEFENKPHLALEVNVDLSEYVPEGYGQCDSALISSDRLHITDYKHGVGVPVSAIDNPQMKLYALGVLKRYEAAYPALKRVTMSIFQPRITEDVIEDEMTVEELRAWGESIKAVAQEAYNGPGSFAPGEWCRFCKGREICAARAKYFMDLEAYEDAVPRNGLTPEQQFEIDKALILGQPTRTTLTDEEVGDLLRRGAELSKWLSDLQSYALNALLEGKEIPGWKVVEGRSNRAFTDTDEALKAIQAEGYEEAMLYDRKPKTLTELEKLMGKKAFAEKIGQYVTKPQGKPTLVEASDKREPYSSMAADAAGLQ